jgi:hypothetical protein
MRTTTLTASGKIRSRPGVNWKSFSETVSLNYHFLGAGDNARGVRYRRGRARERVAKQNALEPPV